VSIRTVAEDVYNVVMLKSLKNLDFLLNRLDRVSISLKEFFSQKFQGNSFAILQRLSQVDFRGVAFSEGGEDFVFVVENWVLLFGFHFMGLLRLFLQKLDYNLFHNNIFIINSAFELPRKI